MKNPVVRRRWLWARDRPQAATPLPGIVAIRGGGWRQGDKHAFAGVARGLAAKGFVTACIEYRVIPEVQFPDTVYDTKAAVRWMRDEGKQYGIATDKIGAIGSSAGGHLVALLGTSYQAAQFEGGGGHPDMSSRVQAVVAMAPVTNFATMRGNAVQLAGYQTAGARRSLITLKDAPHGFWNEPQWAADTIAQAAEFFHQAMGN
jgi:acetyl esterase/lipase